MQFYDVGSLQSSGQSLGSASWQSSKSFVILTSVHVQYIYTCMPTIEAGLQFPVFRLLTVHIYFILI